MLVHGNAPPGRVPNAGGGIIAGWVIGLAIGTGAAVKGCLTVGAMYGRDLT